jgi:hypothetical protein
MKMKNFALGLSAALVLMSASLVKASGVDADSTCPMSSMISPVSNCYLQPVSEPFIEKFSTTKRWHSRTVVVTDPSGEEQKVKLPLRFWGTAGLGLVGLADFDKVNDVLKKEAATYGQPLRTAFKNPAGKAVILVYAATNHGSDVGSARDYFAFIRLEPNATEAAAKAHAVYYTWHFWTDGVLNQAFKSQYWGIKSAKLGRVKLTQSETVKQASLSIKEKGVFKPLSEMIWHVGKMGAAKPVEANFEPTPVVDVWVAQTGKLFAPVLYGGFMLYDAAVPELEGTSLFDAGRGDVFTYDHSSAFGQSLDGIDFKELSWIALTDYSGYFDIPITKKQVRDWTTP